MLSVRVLNSLRSASVCMPSSLKWRYVVGGQGGVYYIYFRFLVSVDMVGEDQWKGCPVGGLVSRGGPSD